MAIHISQNILRNSWYLRPPSFERTMRIARHSLPYAVALAVAPLILASCAELGELRMDITRLRSDLHVNTQTLSQLSERVDKLERRQTDMDRTTRQTQQELSQAVEVLLRKALMAENQQTGHEAGRNPSRVTDHPESQPRPLPLVPHAASTPEKKAHQGRTSLSLGMTQDDVRRMLGDPMSIEHVGAYVFWHYSWLNNQRYVIFEQVGGQVSGWRGL